MNESHRFFSRRIVLICLACVFSTQLAFAPDTALGWWQKQELSQLIWSYPGYQMLARQVGVVKAAIVAKLIEDSEYPELIRSIITVESSWQVRAVSSKNAIGLMQIRMIAAQDIDSTLTEMDLFDPITNVVVGMKIFYGNMHYFERFADTEHWALTAYNRGRAGTFALQSSPPATNYSRRVLELTAAM